MSDWAFDLAFFHNLISNAAAGRGFVQSASTHEANGLLELSHAFFLLPLLVPIYKVFPHLETLLIVQALVLASGVFPLVRLARAAGASAPVTLLCSLFYVSSFPFWRLGLSDFRMLNFAIPALMWLMVALLEGRVRLALLATLFLCLTREELPLLAVSTAGALWIFRKARWRHALVVVGLAGAYFLLLFWLRPRAMGFYIPFDRPGNLLDAWHLRAPGGVSPIRPYEMLSAYLPPGLWPGVLEPGLLLAAIPLLIYQVFFSSYEWWAWYGAYVHHTGPLLAFTAAGATLGWARVEGKAGGFRRVVLLSLLVAVALGQSLWTGVRVYRTMGWADGEALQLERQAQLSAINRLIDRLEGEEAIATDYRLIARLSGRRSVYCYQSAFQGLEAEPASSGPLAPSQGSSSSSKPGLDDVRWMLVDENHSAWIERLEQSSAWSLEDRGGGYCLYHRSSGESE